MILVTLSETAMWPKSEIALGIMIAMETGNVSPANAQAAATAEQANQRMNADAR